MDAVPPTPAKPGWYWDPHELEFNEALRERWRRDLLVLEPENVYRLRKWDGMRWTDETLRDYPQATGTSSLPYNVGPTTRIHPLTRERAAWGFKVWVVAMVLASVFAVVFELLK